ncbi:sensor histidine kinase [Microbispora sp. NPDC049125]|uniref:sensor histidine kinase n=1 Tax=Microbispora sp. NPDC049125 TaxID=3154929 RepID=UPI003467468B
MEHSSHLHDCLYELDRMSQIVGEMRGRLERAHDRQRRLGADISHELLTPLAGLRAELEEAQLHPGETPMQEILHSALADVDRLQRIITDLLLLVRLEAGMTAGLAAVDLAELVRTHVEQRGSPVTMRLRLDPGVTVKAVPSLMERVLSNLLDNAERYAAHEIGIRVRRDGDTAELSVTDDGPGIADADRERVFEVFSRLDEARDRGSGGAGLGLAIARDVTLAHGGTLTAQDTPSGGARFVLRLPLAGSASG